MSIISVPNLVRCMQKNRGNVTDCFSLEEIAGFMGITEEQCRPLVRCAKKVGILDFYKYSDDAFVLQRDEVIESCLKQTHKPNHLRDGQICFDGDKHVHVCFEKFLVESLVDKNGNKVAWDALVKYTIVDKSTGESKYLIDYQSINDLMIKFT